MADIEAGNPQTDDDRFRLSVVFFWIALIAIVWWLLSHFLSTYDPVETSSMMSDTEHSEPAPEPAPAADAWLLPIEDAAADAGFGWLDLSLDESTVSVSGLAPSRVQQSSAFEFVSNRIEMSDAETPEALAIVDNTSIDPNSNAWTEDLLADLDGMEIDWLEMSASGGVATLTGTAPSTEARDEAYQAVSTGIAANETLASRVTLLVNGMVVEGEDGSATEALVELTRSGQETLSVEQCAAAFTRTMQGRNIQFQTGSAAISPESALLLDSLSGIAVLCVNTNEHAVEIGGHTDARGSAGLNLQLSESRANSVRDYLVAAGVTPERLTAMGYGETRLLDDANTPEAHAANRRTEFVIVEAETPADMEEAE